MIDEEQFHRLLISVGYATQRMPCLKEFHMGCYYRFYLYLQNNVDGSMLQWQSHVYQPDTRVAKTWKFDLDDVRVQSTTPFGKCSVTLPRWPPDEPI